MTHTPGPWHIYKDTQEPRYVDEWNAYNVHTKTQEEGIWELATINKLRPEYKSNAYLIAAAPDLLTELKSMYRTYVNLLELGRDRIIDLGGTCDSLEKMETSDPQLRECRVTIAKAEGKEVAA